MHALWPPLSTDFLRPLEVSSVHQVLAHHLKLLYNALPNKIMNFGVTTTSVNVGVWTVPAVLSDCAMCVRATIGPFNELCKSSPVVNIVIL